MPTARLELPTIVTPLCIIVFLFLLIFFFSSIRRHTRSLRDWSSDVCSSDLTLDDAQGRWDQAVRLAIGSDPNSANAKFADFAATTRQALDDQAAAVSDRLASSRAVLLITGWLTLLLGVLAAAAAWWGVSLRWGEYRGNRPRVTP